LSEALPLTPLGSLQRFPRPHSWITGALLLRQGRGGKGKGEERRGSGLPSVPTVPNLSLHHCR